MATPEEMQATMIANLCEKTGRSLEDWIGVVRGSGLEKHGQIVSMLKQEHGMGHGYANLVAHLAREPAGGGGAGSSSGAAGSAAGTAAGAAPDLVEAQYQGKEDLRPIYEKLAAAVGAFGDDVELSPKKSYVSLRRSKQFGLLQPSTKTRLDVGIKSSALSPSGRLEAAGSWNAMVTHRVRVSGLEEVDEELIDWLRSAYEEA